MDAVYTTFKKTLFLLSLALLWLGPLNSRADAQSIQPCGNISLTSQTFQTQCTVFSSGANIPYTGKITYADQATGWLTVNPLSATATASGTTLNITAGGAALDAFPGAHSATVTLTPTGAGTGASFTVTFTPGAGGGGSTGVLSATALQNFCLSGCVNPQNLTLTSSSATPVSFSINAPSWISFSPQSGTVSSSTPVVISVGVNNFSAAVAGQSLAIFYNNTSLAVPIPLGTTGSGTLFASPNTVSWTYSSGGQAPSSQAITLNDSGGSTWNAQITQIDTSYWMLLNAGSTTATGTFSGGVSSFTVLPVVANLGGLSSGTHTAVVTVTDNLGATTSVSITVAINGSGTGGVTANPSSITLTSAAVGSTGLVSGSTTLTSSVSGTFVNPPTQSGTCTGLTPSVSGFGTSGTLTVFGNPSGLTAQTIQCFYTVSVSNGSTTTGSVTIPVTWTIGSGGSGGSSSNPVLPTSLSFATEANATTPLTPQTLTITAPGAWTATVNASPAGWLQISSGGQAASSASGTSTGTSTVVVLVNAAGLTPQTYSGSITFSTTAGSQTVNVSLLDTSSTPVIYANPSASFSLQASSGTIIGSTPQFEVQASDNSQLAYTASTSASWLVLGTTSGTLPAFLNVTIDPSQLGNGTYSGTINISATGSGNTLAVPVVLTVTGSSVTGGGGGTGGLTVSPTSLTFNAQVNGALPPAQTLTATAPAGTTYYISPSGTNNGITWLTVSSSNQFVSGNQTYSVSVNQSGLPIGTYNGTLTFNLTTGATFSVPVTMNVSTTGGTSTVTSTPASLSFAANQGGAAPASQSLSISSNSGAVTFTATASIQNGSTNWLSVTPGSGTTTASVSVSVNPAGLTTGTYNGAIVVTPTNGTALNVPVTLVVSGLPSISASPSTLNLAYSLGGTVPTGSITVTGGTSLTYTATASSNCNCIAVTPATGDTTANPTLTVTLKNTSTITTAGTYTGTITVAGTGNSTGSSTINVTVTVTAPLPTISAVVNAASGASGSVSPGEIVSIFAPATNPIGPATPVALSGSNLVNGNVPLTGLGGVKVTFNGYPAAVIYASSTQVNCVVPYEVAGFNGFPVVVSYLGQTSNGFTVQTSTTMPGVFTQNGAGTGPAAILNANGTTVNGPNNPAPKGSTVAVFMTGEGATSPKGVDGGVTCSAGCASLSQIPIPLLPVSVLVNNQPAAVVFYGEAPNLVAGVMQVNFTIPATAPSGNLSLVVSVGGVQSQQNVTVSVQ